MYTLEVCVDSVESAIAAYNGGANRAELCGNLIIGGTSPSIELFHRIKETIPLKMNVLLRPRFGDFCYTDHEFEILKKEAALFQKAGANGIVIGVLRPDGHFDLEKMAALIDAAEDMEITVHRAFDVCADPFRALCELSGLGVNTILTSGQKDKAIHGMDLIRKLQDQSGEIEIMAGSGVNYQVVQEFLQHTNIRAFHMSGKKDRDSKMVYRKEGVPMGLPLLSEYTIWQTDEAEIAAVRKLLP